ncbi:ATP-binding protein [Xylophilus sp.]|uniref:ATP-binding protein n=1 Tax=Xylophilus sp. TaxID=2653893 RepID=UPI0013BA9A96|nr:ATP-binding protein [Xylophilus sp.]KAF1049764.1 MAG: Gliding motility regulatory protein [Xylophilus sp.]
MSIRQRIILLVVLVFLALGVIGGYAIVQARSNSGQVRTVTDGVVPSAIKSVELMTQLKDVQIATLAMVAAPDNDTARRLLDEVNARKDGLQKALAEQLAQADSPAQSGLIKAAQESLQNYFSSINDTAQFKLAGQTALAEATMGATVDQYLREQGQMIDAVQVEKRRSKDAAIAALNGELTHTSTMLTAISGIAVLALGAIGWLLYRQVIHPIAQMESKMTEIAASQDFTHRLEVTRNDEIGRSMTAFNAMLQKIEESTALVRQKAADIQALLHHVPQGILTVQAGGTVHPEFSDFLRTILETDEIAGRDAMALVFDHTDLGADLRAQTEAALHACLGEDAMNFEFNAHLLPTEVQRRMPDGRVKTLDLSWAPIAGDDGTIQRLLLCVRDVTELRSLARAATAQRRELGLIGEILAVEPEKFHAFAEGAAHYLQENARIVETHGQAEAVGLLFRNMHTIKGNARTYGLQHLTEVVHRVEQHYDAVRSGRAAWVPDELRAQISEVRAALDEYLHIHTAKLGRGGAVRRGEPERIGEALRGVIDALPALAVELGKEEPHVAIEDDGIAVRPPVCGMLRDAFMHLLRNAVDHGIEPPLARIAHGKPAAGTIGLTLALDDDALRIALQDDGQGLDLDRIRAKALSQGLLPADAAPSADGTAQLIFAPGFSTAEQVTEISGRGVGMDAVRGLVEAEGGSIAIVLLGIEGARVRPFRTVITLPARHGVRPGDKALIAA